MSDSNARDARLMGWLSEAYAKEAELEADLVAHISLTEKAAYRKRLQKHLTETREHKRAVARRLKALGGSATAGPSIPLAPTVLSEAAGKAIAAVKGQIGAGRALVTAQTETHLRNAQEELREEHVEIAIYTRIEAFASEVGDTETAKLAAGIRRDEERMAKFLSDEIPRLVRELVRAEVPRQQRAAASSSGRRAGSAGTARRSPSGSRRPASSSRTAAGTSRRSSSARRAASAG